MLNTKLFPIINHVTSNLTKIQGAYNKTQAILKPFLSKNKNILFSPNKEKNNFKKSQIIKNKINGFFLEVLFNGFNYTNKRLKRNRSPFTTDVHRSEVFVIKESPIKSYRSHIHKRRLLFFSYDARILQKIAFIIKTFRVPNTYTAKGIYVTGDSYAIKKVKRKGKK